ncbi:hypothetical protein P9112_010677 [Eukaryota sp. TZLM1-RC]
MLVSSWCALTAIEMFRDRYSEYSTDGVSLRFPFSHTIKPIGKRRTKNEMKEARGAGEVDDFNVTHIECSKTMQQKVTRPRRPRTKL